MPTTEKRDEIGPWQYFYEKEKAEVGRLKQLLETMVKGFAAEILPDSREENIENYWQEFKTKNRITD